MNVSVRVTIAGLFALFLLSGCKSQGIGERCTVGLNSDCEEGLVCVQAETTYGVCCPLGQTCTSNPPETIDAAPFDTATADAAVPDVSDTDGSNGDAASSVDGATE